MYIHIIAVAVRKVKAKVRAPVPAASPGRHRSIALRDGTPKRFAVPNRRPAGDARAAGDQAVGPLATRSANTSLAAARPLSAAGKPAKIAICMMASVISPGVQPTLSAPRMWIL